MTVGDRFSDAFEGREIGFRHTLVQETGSLTWGGHAGLVGMTGDAGTVNATLVGQDVAFDVPGGSTGGYYGGLNLDYALSRSLAFQAGFDGTGWFDGGSEISGRAGLRLRF